MKDVKKITFNRLNLLQEIGSMLQVIQKILLLVKYQKEYLLDLEFIICVVIMILFHTLSLEIFMRPRQTPIGYLVCKRSSINSSVTQYRDLFLDPKIDQPLVLSGCLKIRQLNRVILLETSLGQWPKITIKSRKSILRKPLHRLHDSKPLE